MRQELRLDKLNMNYFRKSVLRSIRHVFVHVMCVCVCVCMREREREILIKWTARSGRPETLLSGPANEFHVWQ